MPDLYQHDVPAAVIERLGHMATADGSSVSAVAVHELEQVSRRAGNRRLLDALPDTGLRTEDLLTQVAAGRAAR